MIFGGKIHPFLEARWDSEKIFLKVYLLLSFLPSMQISYAGLIHPTWPERVLCWIAP